MKNPVFFLNLPKGMTTAEYFRQNYKKRVTACFYTLRDLWKGSFIPIDLKQLLTVEVLEYYKLDYIDPDIDISDEQEIFDLMDGNPEPTLEEFIELMMKQPEVDLTNTDQFDITDDLYDAYSNRNL